MPGIDYIGFDIHKKTISFCVKSQDGTILEEGTIPALRKKLLAWANARPQPWMGAMEATLFRGWIYDLLKPLAQALKVAHPPMLEAIAAAKKKNDKVDARMIADLLRCNLLPECYMAPVAIRTERLHGKAYFSDLLGSLQAVPRAVVELLQLSRGQVEFFVGIQRRLLKELREHPELSQRVMRLQSIPGVGEILALSWSLEVGEVDRLPSIARAVSYCGLTSAQHSSAGKEQRGPISKQRNRHLQTILIEAAKLAPRHNSQLAAVHERELQRGNRNRATLAVARKLVAYLMAVDKSGQPFQIRTSDKEAA